MTIWTRKLARSSKFREIFAEIQRCHVVRATFSSAGQDWPMAVVFDDCIIIFNILIEIGVTIVTENVSYYSKYK